MTEFQETPRRRWNQSPCPAKETMGLGLVQLGEGMALGALNSIPRTDRRGQEGMGEMQPSSLRWCMPGRREAAAQAKTREA